MKRLFFMFALLALVFPTQAKAAVDPRCYTLSECIQARQEFLSAEEAAVNPLYQGSDAKAACAAVKSNSKEEVGFCRPSTKAATSIKIGGKSSFENIGEYIQTIYTTGIVFAGIIAVLVIIISGIQWTASAGNSGVIGAAKTRIVNAIIGLIIASGSYVILSTINPYLINLRLPQSWMIKPVVIGNEYCKDLKEGSSIAKLAPINQKQNEQQIQEAYDAAMSKNLFKSIATNPGDCGTQYVIKNQPGNVCAGNFCNKINGKPAVCAKNTCLQGRVFGKMIQSIPGRDEAWESNMVDGTETEVWAVCANGDKEEASDVSVTHTVIGPNQAEYLLAVEDASLAEATNSCSGGNIVGFILKLEMDENLDPKDENHWVGKEGSSVVDLGDDSAVDKILPKVAKDSSLAQKYLISALDMKNGFTFDIDVSKIQDIDNGDDDRNKFYGEKFGIKFD